METSQQSLLAQAKQGDAKAIAALLNQKLQPKGITAKACVKNNCLHIMLESVRTLQQQPLVELIRKGLTALGVDTWHAVKVYGRREGEDIPDWVEQFDIQIGQETSQDAVILAKQGDCKAIATIINQKLEVSKVVAKVSRKNNCLQIMLEAVEVPNQEQMVALLQAEFQQLGVEGINNLRLYGKQSSEDFPDWEEEVNLSTDQLEPQEVQFTSSESSISSGMIERVQNVAAQQELYTIWLSNQLYDAIQTTCYQHLAYKVRTENNKTIHEIVADFLDNLEIELKQDINQLAKQVFDITTTLGLQLEQTEIQSIIFDVANSNFVGIRLAIRNLERVTQEVLQTDFPQETDALKAFFTGAAEGFTLGLIDENLLPKEAIIGATLGSFIAPGFGSLIGAAIGGWLAGTKQRQALEQLINRYQQARGKIFQEWKSLLELIYTRLSNLLYNVTSIRLLSYQSLDQANYFSKQGNEYLESDFEKAIQFYEQALQLNPGLAITWNNKGYALNQLNRFEEAIPNLIKAIELNRTLVIAFNNLGDSLKGLGRNEEAISTYEESLKLDPENYYAWSSIAICLCRLQQFDEAIEACDVLIQIDANDFTGWYIKAACLALLGDQESAIANLREAVRLDSNSSQQLAKVDSSFNDLREDERFKELMESSVGVSYALLKQYLKQKQWRNADQETARVMKEVIQKVTNSTEINRETLSMFPCTDLHTIDLLWWQNSEGRFGFSAQKRIFEESSKDRNIFGTKIGWRIQDTDGNWFWLSNAQFTYNSRIMPNGHLPTSLWAGEDGWFENRRDRLIALFDKIDNCMG